MLGLNTVIGQTGVVINEAPTTGGKWIRAKGVYTFLLYSAKANICHTDIENRLTGTGTEWGSVTIDLTKTNLITASVSVDAPITALLPCGAPQVSFSILSSSDILVNQAIRLNGRQPGRVEKTTSGGHGINIKLRAGANGKILMLAPVENSGANGSNAMLADQKGGNGGNSGYVYLKAPGGILMPQNVTSNAGKGGLGKGAGRKGENGKFGLLNIQDGVASRVKNGSFKNKNSL